MAATGHLFKDFMAIYHPPGSAGEESGRSPAFRQLWTALCFERLAKILAALLRQRGACTLYPGHDRHLSSTWSS